MDTNEFKPIYIKLEKVEKVENAEYEEYEEHIEEYDEAIDQAIDEANEEYKNYEPVEKLFKTSAYCKKITLQHLKSNGMDLRKIFKKSKCSPHAIVDYINDKAKKSQENVHFECNSPSFKAINNWLEKFKEHNFNLENNELGLAIKLISVLEEHPSPEESEGINFSQLYAFLGKVMSGEPTIELDQPTKQFLWECFEEISDEVNGPNGDKHLDILKHILKSNTIHPYATGSRLDPLNINNISDILIE